MDNYVTQFASYEEALGVLSFGALLQWLGSTRLELAMKRRLYEYLCLWSTHHAVKAWWKHLLRLGKKMA